MARSSSLPRTEATDGAALKRNDVWRHNQPPTTTNQGGDNDINKDGRLMGCNYATKTLDDDFTPPTPPPNVKILLGNG